MNRVEVVSALVYYLALPVGSWLLYRYGKWARTWSGRSWPESLVQLGMIGMGVGGGLLLLYLWGLS